MSLDIYNSQREITVVLSKRTKSKIHNTNIDNKKGNEMGLYVYDEIATGKMGDSGCDQKC
jgi:hypothetical protein